MAYTTINKSTDYFNTKLYTGNGADGNAVTNVGHSPDFVWIKQRNSMSHRLYDKIRGVNSALISNESNAEDQYSAYGQFESFDSDGFTVGAGTSNGHGTNENGQSIVSWNWKANGAGSANTAGSINSTVSANTTAGFSIVSYTGTGTDPETIGHGLGVVPKMIIVKDRNTSGGWRVYNENIGNNKVLALDGTIASTTSDAWNSTTPTSSLFTVGNDTITNGNGTTHIAYCFAEKVGYSKFGSYTGNGNADGTFVYTGFKPSFVIIKNSSNAHNWTMIDDKRLGYNDKNYVLFPDLNNSEPTTSESDIVSNGFKVRASANGVNQSGNTMIYMAFGQSIVGSNNVPCTAR